MAASPPERPGRPAWRFLLETLAPLSAIVISVASLVVAVRQGEVQERLMAAASWPFIQASTSNVSGSQPLITLGVVNSGQGPALLKWVRVRYRGSVVRGAGELVSRCCGHVAPGVVTGTLSGSVIPAGQTLNFVQLLRTPESEASWSALNRARFDIRYDACYCSITGECWRSDLQGLEPRSVQACGRPPDAYAE